MTAKPLFSTSRTHGDLVLTSGQVGLDADRKAPPDFASQCSLALDNLEAALEAAGASLATVLKTTVFVVDRDDVAKMNELYVQRFPEPRPARSAIVTDLVRPDLLFEIEAIAYVP